MDKGIEGLTMNELAERNAALVTKVYQLSSALEQSRQSVTELEKSRRGIEESLISAVERIAKLEAAPNAMMQLSNELAEMKPVKLPSAWVEPGNRWLQERDVIEAIRAAGGEVSGE